jgi:hypothetical protein
MPHEKVTPLLSKSAVGLAFEERAGRVLTAWIGEEKEKVSLLRRGAVRPCAQSRCGPMAAAEGRRGR